MEKRFQVFVSSTYQDLQEERQEVMHALLELDCIPSGMELFPAANESQWSLIKRVINDCDYYILIIGGRYGSVGPEGMSYTEMEYRYAVSIGKPTIAFLHSDPGKITAEKSEESSEGKEKLRSFREAVQHKMCKYWSTPADLGSVVSRSVVQLMKTTPAIGWVRADELPDRDATLELLRLRTRVEDLESELQRARTSAPKGTEDLAQGDEQHLLKYTFAAYDPLTYMTTNWNGSFYARWNDIFAAVAPLMINEASDSALHVGLNEFVRATRESPLRQEKQELKNVVLRSFQLSHDDFQTVKVQFRALGLIRKSDKPRSVKDIDTYWTLTPYGDDLMTRLRAIKRSPIITGRPVLSRKTKKKPSK
jgi:hypothetical protein